MFLGGNSSGATNRRVRFLVEQCTSATDALGEQLIERAVTTTVQRTQQRELHWWSSGWHGYQSIIV
jgi:hypothetical protein